MSTMGDVLDFFEQYTGLGWYPDPAKVSKSEVLGTFVKLIDEVIALQARGTHRHHVAAQNDAAVDLVAEAAGAFTAVRNWVTGLSKDQRTELRRFSNKVLAVTANV